MSAKKSENGHRGKMGVVPLASHPEYKPQLEKLAALRAEMDQLRKTINEKRGSAPSSSDPPNIGQRQRQALRAAELPKLCDRQDAIDEEIHILEESMAHLQARLSREQEPVLMPAYRAVQRRILEAIVDLAQANELERAFFAELDALGYSLPQMIRNGVALVGVASDYQSLAAELVREAIAGGTITPKDPLVQSVAALTGRELFLPGNRERFEREQREEAARREKHRAEPREGQPRRRLWGGEAPATPAAAKNGKHPARRNPTPEEILGERVHGDMLEELESVFSLTEAPAGRA
jgi:hypothetical protein